MKEFFVIGDENKEDSEDFGEEKQNANTNHCMDGSCTSSNTPRD